MTRRVLLVDDDADVRLAYSDLLQSAGYSVTAASTGEQALEMVDGVRPDVIVLDVGLPGLDGIEVARELSDRRIPIVMITGLDEFPVGNGLSGIDSIRLFLRKPCRTETFLKGIGDTLG